ncbi:MULTISPECIES: cupin domain-containing protein [unclassified Rathayibacter]|uniref:cupin domain-containing protein n=1 Tax=unclassified Rathayibacter TaxID=2609250 RepID=UPI000FB84CDD|nr:MULTISPECIES: cupin domain-containing protein [unclassified Rathayibacter]ROP49123.1 antibiotic biosynthesis monooxygenase [Rathayibacter sp. PhB186]ROS50760.1 antibiotic biosynthesis monooxygenase [Rathayibacter sp. PhB185]
MPDTFAISSSSPRVLRLADLPSKDRGAGARTTPLVTAARGGTSYLNGITQFQPGAAIGHHTHNVAESVIVIQGHAIVDIDGAETPLSTFDTTFVPANIPHHFTNASDTEPMAIFWTYGSLDSTRTMVATGEHGRIDGEHARAADDVRIVREIAQIDVLPGHDEAFEKAVAAAAPLFQQARGARTLQLERSDEFPLRYRLIVGWETVEDHMVGFRGSEQFQAWRALIGEHLAGPPQVEHMRNVLTAF